ncbi:MAG TPA: cupredoxin domain-containing protein [Polyangiaceae bacterium]
MWKDALRTSGVIASLGLCAALGCSRSESAPKKAEPEPTLPAPAAGVQQTKVIVDSKGFTPSQVKVEKGKPASLVFVRTTEETCAKEVVFPEIKLEKPLPLNTPVVVDIPTSEPRILTFQCGMAMYKSAVLIQ